MSIIRDVTTKAENYLESSEILLFTGARQVGKTTILRQLEATLKARGEAIYFVNLEDPDYLELLNKSPKNLFKIFNLDLQKRSWVFIDEVQYLANPSNFLKYLYDEHAQIMKLIVSGSSAFYLDKKFKDSLVGRKKIFKVMTLSFRELLRFKGEVALARADFGKLPLSDVEKVENYFREYLVYGGYPRVVLAALEEKKDILHELAYSYIKKDLYDSKVRDDEVFYKLLKILAAQVGGLVNSSELAATLGVTKTAIDNYLSILERSFHIFFVRPFYKNVRKELTKMPKAYFMDLGLRNFFVASFDPWEMRGDRGQITENAFARSLLAQWDREEIKFWRTTQKNEVDFVVAEKWAYEVKADPKKAKLGNYRLFTANYPRIPLEFIGFDQIWRGEPNLGVGEAD